MIRYSEEFAKKDFKADTMKDAYMKAVKWYSTNILSNDILKDVQVSYEKVDSENKPIIRMRLFAPLDESTLRRNSESNARRSSMFSNSKIPWPSHYLSPADRYSQQLGLHLCRNLLCRYG